MKGQEQESNNHSQDVNETYQHRQEGKLSLSQLGDDSFVFSFVLGGKKTLS